jgi:hypothetical protein|tara:strand:- start:377 stop:565 length:189 start_codon:yes stop_codon:yes gene_type:complete
MNQAHLPSKISILAIALFVSLSTAFSKQRPNIIFILMDDMGFSDQLFLESVTEGEHGGRDNR